MSIIKITLSNLYFWLEVIHEKQIFYVVVLQECKHSINKYKAMKAQLGILKTFLLWQRLDVNIISLIETKI